jgi:hypothetical protein
MAQILIPRPFVYPGHNDLLPNNTIPYAEIIDALERIAPHQKYKVLQPGELYYYVKPVT